MVEFHKLTPPQLGALWEMVLPGLEQVLVKSEQEVLPQTVLSRVAAGELDFWLVTSEREYAGFLITETNASDTRRWFNISFGFSRTGYDAKRQGFEYLEEVARKGGYSGIRFFSTRKGFDRLAPNLGYTPRFREYVKEF